MINPVHLMKDTPDPVAIQEAKLSFFGRLTVQGSVKRMDARETFWFWMIRFLWVGSDETEALALVISPICMMYILNKYCCKKGSKVKKA